MAVIWSKVTFHNHFYDWDDGMHIAFRHNGFDYNTQTQNSTQQKTLNKINNKNCDSNPSSPKWLWYDLILHFTSALMTRMRVLCLAPRHSWHLRLECDLNNATLLIKAGCDRSLLSMTSQLRRHCHIQVSRVNCRDNNN